MSILYYKGDLFKADAAAFAHGVNTQGVMGAGIAYHFQRRYPLMFEEYKSLCTKKLLIPGEYYAYTHTDGKVILNLATQDYPGARARYEWLDKALRSVVRELPGLASIALPRIGAGLGGLEWELVKSVLEKIASTTSTNLLVYSL